MPVGANCGPWLSPRGQPWATPFRADFAGRRGTRKVQPWAPPMPRKASSAPTREPEFVCNGGSIANAQAVRREATARDEPGCDSTPRPPRGRGAHRGGAGGRHEPHTVSPTRAGPRGGGVVFLAEKLARPRGFEPLTPRSVVWCSIQLSYGRNRRRRRPPGKAGS
jgi:hypothetical protein